MRLKNLEELFKLEFFRECSIAHHPKAEQVYAIAVKHSYGFASRAIIFDDLCELVLD